MQQTSKNCVPNCEQVRIMCPNLIEEPKILSPCCYIMLCHMAFLILRCPIVCLYFYVINMADEKECEKIIH